MNLLEYEPVSLWVSLDPAAPVKPQMSAAQADPTGIATAYWHAYIRF